MKRIHWLLSLSSLSVLLVTIERFSPTTKIVLQPDSFLRLHEFIQIILIILFTTIIPFLVFKETSQNFDLLKTKKGFILALLFITGIYFYATGNGVHEVASYNFNSFCPTKHFTSTICKSSFFNDYYFGNILYFIGAFLMTFPIILLEIMKPQYRFTKKDTILLVINAVIYAFAIFAYAAFDRVLVGLYYSVITTIIVDFLFFTSKRKFNQLPFTFYSMIVYTLGTIASLLIRFHS